MALPSSDRQGATVIWVTLHTAEGARRASDLYAFFDRNQNSSSHVGIDASGVYDWIDRSRYAWTLLNGNRVSVNAELCAFARWTRAQWLSTEPVDGCASPRQIVYNAAQWAKRECEALGIPKEYIGVSGVQQRRKGIIDHDDYSDGTGDGDHHDVGESFPLDVFFADMEGDDMLNAEQITVTNSPWGDYAEMADKALGAVTGRVASIEEKVDGISEKVDTLGNSGVPVDLKLSEADRQDIADRVLDGLRGRLEA